MTFSREREDELSQVYFQVRRHPGWLAGVIQSFTCTKEETEYLETLDDLFLDVGREVDQWIRETARERSLGLLDLETNDVKVAHLSHEIAQAYADYETAAEKDEPLIERILMMKLRQVERMEYIRLSLRARTFHSRPRGTNRPDQLTDQEIVKARTFPLERLVIIEGRLPYVLCPWHDDKKPSMLIKGGYGYCFSCGAWADSLKWLMEVDKLVFPDAVRHLNRL